MSEYEVPEKKTVAVDFDGVIHSYVSGWEGADVISDPPIEGAIEFLNEIAEHFTISIFTTRAAHEGAEVAIREWLHHHGFEGECSITHEKGPAIFYLDDRAWRFRGSFPTVSQIKRAFPWRVGEPLPAEIAKKRALKRRDPKTIKSLEESLGRKKAIIRQMRSAMEATIAYFPEEETMPPPVAQMKGFLK